MKHVAPLGLLIAAASLLIFSAHPSSAAPNDLLGKNLIVNGDAEQGPGSPDDSHTVDVPGWVKHGQFNVVQYGASGGFADAQSPGPTDRGKNYFVGGPENPESSAYQDIKLAGLAPDIAKKHVKFTLSAYVGGYEGQGDATTLVAAFLNAKGSVLKRVVLGPVTPKDRDNNTSLLARTATGLVPVGTHSVRVKLDMKRTDGSYNDASADNISLILSE